MSTTKSLQTAVEYSSSETPVLMRISSEDWSMRGADVAFLSAFPSEKEMVSQYIRDVYSFSTLPQLSHGTQSQSIS